MATTSSIKNIAKLTERFKSELAVLMDERALIALVYIDRHDNMRGKELDKRLQRHIKDLSQVLAFLVENGYALTRDSRWHSTPEGRQIVTMIEDARYKMQNLPKDSIPDYVLEKPIGCGATSCTFKARRNKIWNKVIKIFKPGLLDHIDLGAKLEKLQSLTGLHSLVVPDDYGNFEWCGRTFKYVVMQYISGQTLQEFLQQKPYIDVRKFLDNFINEVGKTLVLIENSKLSHGDLHAGNILVVEEELEKGRGIYHFKVIDFVGINSADSYKEYEISDFEFFRDHLMTIMRIYANTASGEPDLKLLGGKYSQVFSDLKSRKYDTFNKFFDAISSMRIISPKLNNVASPPFSYLKFEQFDINDPKWLMMFSPDVTLYGLIKRFDNTICSGPRGCGKTVYLRSLSFVPLLIRLVSESGNRQQHFHSRVAFLGGIFGVYFACRQGEFKYFSSTNFDFTPKAQLLIKHIIVLRIMRKVFNLINGAYKEDVFSSKPNLPLILQFLERYLMKEILLTSDATERPFTQLVSVLAYEESLCGGILEQAERQDDFKIAKMLSEDKLIEFFRIMRKSIHELEKVKFYIIFDDVSEPQVPIECQRIINSFMTCLNDTYCCKFSTEKFAYTYDDMSGKTLQPTNDYTYVDLSFVGGHEDKYADRTYKKYLNNIINRRLEMAEIRKSIDSMLADLPYNVERLIQLFAESAEGNQKSSSQIRFAGWNLVVQLSSRSVRDAIALCDAIFRECQKTQKVFNGVLKGEKIPVAVQDRAIRMHSKQEYKGLLNIAYYGQSIFNIVRNFGEISRRYLMKQITREPRRCEMITIERVDADELSERAREVFRAMIRYSVFVDRGLSFSREEIGLVQKLTLHKKFTAALMTSYREREHLRLSSRDLERLLLYPDEFRRQVVDGITYGKDQLELFGPEDR